MKKYFRLFKNNVQISLFILVFLLLVPVLGVTCMYKYFDFQFYNRIDYTEWSAKLGSKLETDIASSFFKKFSFVNLNGAVRNVLGQREMNEVTKLTNGKLAQPFGDPPGADTYVNFANNTAMLRDFLQERDCALLFMMAPYAISPYDPQLPAGVEDYTNAHCDTYINLIKEHGVDVLDIREELHNDGISQYDMMYRTDHHWTTDAGFYAYGKLEPYLVEKTGCYVDPRISDISQYEITVYPEQHLGMYGQRTGKYFGGIDDFVLYTPKFNALLQKAGSDQAGNLQAVFLDTTTLTEKDHTSRYTYDEVLGGLPVDSYRYTCRTSGNDTKLLVISDSFFKAIAPYLIMGYSDVTYAHYSEAPLYTTAAFLEEQQFDAVIMLYEPGIIGAGGTPFHFLSDLNG